MSVKNFDAVTGRRVVLDAGWPKGASLQPFRGEYARAVRVIETSEGYEIQLYDPEPETLARHRDLATAILAVSYLVQRRNHDDSRTRGLRPSRRQTVAEDLKSGIAAAGVRLKAFALGRQTRLELLDLGMLGKTIRIVASPSWSIMYQELEGDVHESARMPTTEEGLMAEIAHLTPSEVPDTSADLGHMLDAMRVLDRFAKQEASKTADADEELCAPTA